MEDNFDPVALGICTQEEFQAQQALLRSTTGDQDQFEKYQPQNHKESSPVFPKEDPDNWENDENQIDTDEKEQVQADPDDGWADEDGDGWDEKDEPPKVVKTQSILEPYKMFTLKDIQAQIPKKVAQADDLLCLNNDDFVIAVMRHFKWDQSKINDVWFAKDQQKLRYEIGLDYDESLVTKYAFMKETLAEHNDNECKVMYMPFDDKDKDFRAMSLSACGHQFSAIAWVNYLQTAVESKGQSCVFTKCQQTRCNVVVPHSWFMTLLKDSPKFQFKTKYLQWHCRQFTDTNHRVKWCPQKGCNYLCEISPDANIDCVICKCGKAFCIYCAQEAHQPASCEQVTAWFDKEKSDSANIQWIQANTKPCPKCRRSIEKNQGCNHMTCSQCRYEFCWLCLGDWKKHGGYNCNDARKNNEFLEQQKTAEQAKHEIERYVFHYERFNNHGKSGEHMQRLMTKILDQIQLLHELMKYPQDELKFIEETQKIIIECRQVLRWTYVALYFMPGRTSKEKGAKDLFMHQQSQLENACEICTQHFEQDISHLLNPDNPDRSPFYQFKSTMITLKETLSKQFNNFVDAIIIKQN